MVADPAECYKIAVCLEIYYIIYQGEGESRVVFPAESVLIDVHCGDKIWAILDCSMVSILVTDTVRANR